MKWTWGDWLMSGILAAAAGLCVWGAVVAEGAGRAVSAATGLAFLGGTAVLIGIRWSASRADYVTPWGLRVRVGKLNKPSVLLVSSWEEWVVEQLSAEYPAPDLVAALDGLLVVFVDAPKLQLGALGRWVRGYADGQTAVVGLCGGLSIAETGARSCVRVLFGHEVGHNLLGRLGVPWAEEEHHAILARVGIG